MPLSRPNFASPHMCPGWAGAGYGQPPSVDRCPQRGRIRTNARYWSISGEYKSPATNPMLFGYCDDCDIVTLPYAVRWLSPTTYLIRVRHARTYRWARATLSRLLHPRRYASNRVLDAARSN